MMSVAAVALLLGVVAGHDPNHVDPNMVFAAWTKPATPDSVEAKSVDYAVGGVDYEGYLAKPKEGAPVGALLVAHAWRGLLDTEKARAEQFAAMGYVAFAADVYGKGQRCSDADCAGQKMNAALADIPKLRSLISAATTELVKAYGGDKDKLVAMGYCFGGAVVLDLARHPNEGASAGVTFKAVSAIHSTFTVFNNERAEEGTLVTGVQVHHAQLDFDQSQEGLPALEIELNSSTTGLPTRWEIVTYGQMEHGWTDPSGGAGYDASAAIQCHDSTFAFFQDAVGNTDPSKDDFPIRTCKKETPTPAPTPALNWNETPFWSFLMVASLMFNAGLGFMACSRGSGPSGSGGEEGVGLAEIS